MGVTSSELVVQRLLEFTQVGLDSMERVPGMWGTPQMVEATYLTYLSVWDLIRHPEHLDSHVVNVWTSWFRHAHTGFTVEMAADQVSQEELVRYLQRFRKMVQGGTSDAR